MIVDLLSVSSVYLTHLSALVAFSKAVSFSDFILMLSDPHAHLQRTYTTLHSQTLHSQWTEAIDRSHTEAFSLT